MLPPIGGEPKSIRLDICSGQLKRSHSRYFLQSKLYVENEIKESQTNFC